MRSFPVEGALLPLVGEADDEDGEEDHHRPEAGRADLAQRDIGATGFWAMMVFLAILVVGFAYEWKQGALDWE